MKDIEGFSSLPDSALVRIVPVEGGLPAEQATSVVAVLTELLNEWRSNGVIVDGKVEPILGGKFLLIAYQARAADLSGCTKDSLTHALAALEQALGRRLINAPRLAVETSEGFRLLSHAEFRALREAGKVTLTTPVYDMLVRTLGDVRAGKFATTVGESWYGRVGG